MEDGQDKLEKIKKEFASKGDFLNLIISITIGATIYSIGQNLFVMPAGLLSGGLSGLSLIGYYSFNIPAGIGYFILNIPMVILSLKTLSKKFTYSSFYAVIIISITQMLTEGLIGSLNVNDLFINSLFGGIIRGIGSGLIYRYGSSSMGTDVLAVLMKRKFNISIGNSNMLFNFVILGISAFLYGVEITLYTMFSSFVLSKVADNIMLGVGERKNVMIVSKKYEEIAKAINTEIHRGVTLLSAEGAYTKESSKLILTVVSNRQVAKLRTIVDEIDPNAFFTISDSIEVRGKGFKNLGTE